MFWLAFSGYWYTCKVRCACNEPLSFFNSSSNPTSSDKAQNANALADSKKDKKKANKSEPKVGILFNCNESGFVKGDDYDSVIQTLQEKTDLMDKLYIFGLYSLEETNRSKYENLGLARAGAIRQQLRKHIDIDKMAIESVLNKDVGTDCDEPFQAVRFLWE